MHVILLDNRSGRDPTYSKFGECQGSDTKILSDQQWAWLEEELERQSEIKIIGSGIQVGVQPVHSLSQSPQPGSVTSLTSGPASHRPQHQAAP